MRVMCAFVLVVGLAMPAQAEEAERGWFFSGSFTGSTNSDGIVTKAEPVVGYAINNHLRTYAGLPFYMVNVASSTATAATGGSMAGIGNALVGARLGINGDAVNYSSNLEFTAPTGDKSRGFSTGRVTADWTNRFSHTFSSFTPFASVGIANTVSDTAFFVRPFTSLGLVTHFEGGTTYELSQTVQAGGSAYAVRGSGQQTIISKIAGSGNGSKGISNKNRVFETVSETITQNADLVDDHGYSAWIGVTPNRALNFRVGYSRSVNYDYNTLFFGVGFHAGK
jgi:hypothetical protein